MKKYNYNLKKEIEKLLKEDEKVPQLSDYLSEELKEFGEVQYTLYNDGEYKLSITSDSEIKDFTPLKTIVLNHNILDSFKIEKHKKLNSNTTQKIVSEYPLEIQLSSSFGIYGKEHFENMKKRIKDLVDTSNVIQEKIYKQDNIEKIKEIKLEV